MIMRIAESEIYLFQSNKEFLFLHILTYFDAHFTDDFSVIEVPDVFIT